VQLIGSERWTQEPTFRRIKMDDEYKVVDLLDGRFALKKNGLVVSVARSQEELREYLDKRFSVDAEMSSQSLGDAIRRM
jgi:hypothetical protein